MKLTKNYTSVGAQWLLLTCFVAITSGCSIYRINVLQGNFIDQEKIDQVEAGMTRNQVKYLLGTPLIEDSFHNDRWDYVYRAKLGRTGKVFSRKVTVYFDGDAVRSVDQYGQNTTPANPETETEAEAES